MQVLIISHLQSSGSDNDILSETDDSIFVVNNSLVLIMTPEAEQQPCTIKIMNLFPKISCKYPSVSQEQYKMRTNMSYLRTSSQSHLGDSDIDRTLCSCKAYKRRLAYSVTVRIFVSKQLYISYV